MRLRQIEIFYHVYRAGSISGAARNLFVSQPSVSKVLRHLEDQLGFELFTRDKGRLIATDAAHELYADVDRIYDQIRMLKISAANIRNRRGEHLRLGVLPSLSLSVGPELISRMRDNDPLFSFELTTLHSAEIGKALYEKRSDLCIGFEPLEDPLLKSYRIGAGKLVLVSGDAIEHGDGPIDPAILHGTDFIGMRESGPLGTLIGGALSAREIEPNEIVTAHTYHVALSLARKRVGFAIADQYTAFSHLGTGLHRYMLEDLPEFEIFATALADHPYVQLIEDTVATLRKVLVDFDRAIAELVTPA
ncbi:LysR family transcriptional regulator [Altererythrobacter arenosus]|uniref:LysR family transcriptional regulator n=1 Tax=Altererythrobacter arenosus TaxID=3032592 RepID=A0ABY8FQN4_9SPHN|nr:LysR family transcriptional regulator [Altererythrobacter sp. CAU 1644]WFL76415.1 LysR family transcriptional regulator [Altererythrobacter sp. CAU 1644]